MSANPAVLDSNSLPEEGQNNIWFRNRTSNTTLVFVHGVLSDSRSCWLASGGAYWPRLLAEDERFRDVGIFLGGYYTAIDAGQYEIRNAADELLAALGRGGNSSVLASDRILFVCHSTGGIVVRYILNHNAHLFAEKRVGLVLIASPSLGSEWANRLGWLAAIYGHSVGQQLQAGHWTLREIDAQFKNLVNDRRIPHLVGIEAYENHFIIHKKWLPDRQVVVTEESAGRYFGAPILLRQTDHFGTAKPTDRRHPSYELLSDFFEKHFASGTVQVAPGATPTVSFVFELHPTYPRLRFSLTNVGPRAVQITHLRAFKVAAMKDEHERFRHLMGPRMKLNFNLKAAPEGVGAELLDGNISNLAPGASEAFEIRLEVENMVALVDFEAECVTATSPVPKIARPAGMVLVHAPTQDDKGQIAIMARRELWQALLSETEISPWPDRSYRDCHAHGLALVRGAATLGFDDPVGAWEQLRGKFESSSLFGFILASYADGLAQGFVPEAAKAFLTEFMSDPKKIKQLTIIDTEAPARTISRALAKAVVTPAEKGASPNLRGSYELGMADRMLEVDTAIDDPDDAEEKLGVEDTEIERSMGRVSLRITHQDILATIAQEFGPGSVEFLVATLVVQPHLYHEIHDLLAELTRRKNERAHHDEGLVVGEWWNWWQRNAKPQYTSLQWRERSPRLARALAAFKATDPRALADYIVDPDEVVRFAAARSPAAELRHLEILARDPRPGIRFTVVKNPLTPTVLLKILVRDENSIVRRWIVKHPNADQEILSALRSDRVKGVRTFAEKAQR